MKYVIFPEQPAWISTLKIWRKQRSSTCSVFVQSGGDFSLKLHNLMTPPSTNPMSRYFSLCSWQPKVIIHTGLLSVKRNNRLFLVIWTTESVSWKDILVLRLLSVDVLNSIPTPTRGSFGSEIHIFSMVIWAVLFSPGLTREAKRSRVWGNGFTPCACCGCVLTVI